MDAINQNLHDASWWFGVWVALMIGVIAGLLVARVDRRLAATSSMFRARSAKRAERREQVIKALSESPQMLAIAYLDGIFGIVLLTALILMSMQLKDVIQQSDCTRLTMLMLLCLVWFAVVYSGFIVSRRLKIAQEAWKKPVLSHGLPWIW